MPNFRPLFGGAGTLVGGLLLCYFLGDSLPAPASVIVNGCANKVGFVHSGSNIGQNCAGPKVVGGQAVGIATASGTTLAAGALSVTTGNALAVFVGYLAATNTATVADTAGNTFTLGAACNEDGNEHGIWFWAANVTGNASDVVTVTFGLSQGHREITVFQFSGASTSAPKDFNGACGTNNSITPTATSAAFTTTAANEVLLAGVQGGTNSNTFTAGAGYTLGTAIGGVAGGRTEFKSVSAIQTGVTASMTFGTNTAWAVTILTIK